MSHEAVAYVKRLEIRSSPQKLILFMLADRVNNETGRCYPGLELIARETSISLTQVKTHIAALRLAGVLTTEQRRTKEGRRTSNYYEICGFKEWLHRVEQVGLGAAILATAKLNGIEKPDKNPEAGNPAVVSVQQPGFRDPTAGNPALVQSRKTGQESKDSFLTQRGEKANLKPNSPGRSRQGRFEYAKTAEQEQGEKEQTAAAVLDREDFEAFADVAREVGLDVPAYLTTARRQSLRDIRSVYGVGAWAAALANLRRSPFCAGRNKKGWRITFDVLVKEDWFVKVLEGAYLDEGPAASSVVDLSKAKAFTPQQWRIRLGSWQDGGRQLWPSLYGPAPGEAGCLVPPDLLAEFGVDVVAA